MPVKLTARQLQINPAGSWTTVQNRHILDVSGSLEISGDSTNALAFGDSSDVRLSVKLSSAALSSVPDKMPIRITLTVDGVDQLVFTGIVVNAQRTYKGHAWTLECEGVRSLIGTTRRHSPAFYRRRVATKTTVSSVEDPAEVGYQAGLINYGLWVAGGRPKSQDFKPAYVADALFWYEVVEDALLAPDYSWLAGEDTWEECLKLARAAGGQICQDGDGVVRYYQPLSFASGSATYTFTPAVYEDIEEETPTERLGTKFLCTYTPRTLQGMQPVIDDATPRQVEPGASVTITLEPRYPVWSIELTAGQLAAAAITANFYDSRTVPQGASGYTHTVSVAAQQVTIVVTNASSLPFQITRIKLNGEPIVPGESAQVSAGTGTIERTLEDNPFIQSRAHAQRLVNMHLAFYGTSRPVRTLKCVYDPARVLRETVNLTAPAWSITAEPHLITAIHHSKTGKLCEYRLVSIAGLPKTGDFFLVGSTHYSGQSKQLCW